MNGYRAVHIVLLRARAELLGYRAWRSGLGEALATLSSLRVQSIHEQC